VEGKRETCFSASLLQRSNATVCRRRSLYNTPACSLGRRRRLFAGGEPAHQQKLVHLLGAGVSPRRSSRLSTHTRRKGLQCLDRQGFNAGRAVGAFLARPLRIAPAPCGEDSHGDLTRKCLIGLAPKSIIPSKSKGPDGINRAGP
jgi:hypothetical protein